MTIAAQFAMTAQLPVTATNPHSTPFKIATVSHFVPYSYVKPAICFRIKKHVIPPVAGPIIEFMNALSAIPAFDAVDVPNVLPALKKSHPNQRVITPNPTIGML